MKKENAKKTVEKMKKKNVVVAYCCCGNARTRSTHKHHVMCC